jgi:hypothetical protein
MGAWGAGPFDSDDAVDWLMSFFRTPGLALVDRSFAALERDSGRYIDAPTASDAWLSAEVLGSLTG